MRRWLSRSEGETRAIGRALGKELAPDGILLLHGDLGAGKTELVRGIAEYLEIEAQEIQSPTYTLIREHEGPGGRLSHLDLYRLEAEETETLGLDELLSGPGIKAVEWAERLTWIPAGALSLTLRRSAEGERELTSPE